MLTIHSNYPCDQIQHELAKNVVIEDRNSRVGKRHLTPNKQEFAKRYTITTKTGKVGTEANVFIRLYDDQNRQSEDISLQQTVTNKIPFGKHEIDEFHTGTVKNLSDLQKIYLWHTGGKNQEWNLEWLQVEDIDANRLYCFPVVGG
jgi:hypothetical protein